MSVRVAVAAFVIGVTIQPAAASDPGADFVLKLFMEACIPNFAQPAKVRQWAEQHHLAQIENAAALGLFVGAGDKGAAWAIPVSAGSFVLSIRGITQACAVWAKAADSVEVEVDFKKIVENVARPGIRVTVDKTMTEPTPSGTARMLVYNVTAPGAPTSFEFTMLTAERPGGAFQASLQAAKAGAHPN